MSDVTLSPGGLPQNTMERGSPKPERGLSAFHTFEAQKEEPGSSKSRLIAGVAVAVMLAAAVGYSYEASHSVVPAKPAAQQSNIIATTPPATSPPVPADNMSAPAPENNMTAPAAAPPIATAPVAAHARVTHNAVTHNAPARGAGGADNAMQARMSHTSDAPANVTPPASQTLTPDATVPAPSTVPSQTVTPTTGSASTPVPVQTAPTTTTPNTQNQTTPSDDPATN